MSDPATLTTAIENATKVANTSLFTAIVDKITGFKISQWAAEGEVRKKLIHDEYKKAKDQGILGMQYIEYLRHATNLIDTAVQSSKYIDPDKENKIEMDNDFFWNTMEHAKTVSDNNVRELIAKIIAGEYNQPGSYSMSTLQTLKMLGKTELQTFAKIGTLCMHMDFIPENVFTLPEDLKEFMKSIGIDYGHFLELQSLGLFLSNEMSKNLFNPNSNIIVIDYFDRQLKFQPNDTTKFNVRLPKFYALSNTGKQILANLTVEPSEIYYQWLRINYTIPNYTIVAEL